MRKTVRTALAMIVGVGAVVLLLAPRFARAQQDPWCCILGGEHGCLAQGTCYALGACHPDGAFACGYDEFPWPHCAWFEEEACNKNR